MNAELKKQFLIHEDIAFLNFDSFGACPKPIFEDYQKWQLELEQEPAQFIQVNGPTYLKQSREALAKYINCADANDLVYVTNPSYATNIIAKSLKLNPGDEILTTNLEYGVADKAWEYYCKKAGAKYVRQNITLPITTKEKFIEEFFAGLSPKTKLIFISEITSTTALKFPAKEICEMAKQKGIITFVDGAHTVGHIPLDLSQLKADIYTGACHKWMLTPKGSSFLYVKKEFQKLFDPLLVSWGYDAMFPTDSQFQDYHQMQGTRDFSAFLTIPKAIEFMNQNNWLEVAKESREMVQKNALRFCNLVGSKPLCPITDEWLGQMFSIPISTPEPEKLQRHLFVKYKIEIPVMRHGDKTYLRYSINAFNSQNDLDRLYDALKEIIETTDLITKK
ncbi:MAG: aminotransferase class V-fold PLP-dependent enzyme [Sphingobacteriaceae bacterium]|nr:aminotransferase class V-fold PLP-dependent enzyme [Sphingobacteriaceae bacterium]